MKYNRKISKNSIDEGGFTEFNVSMTLTKKDLDNIDSRIDKRLKKQKTEILAKMDSQKQDILEEMDSQKQDILEEMDSQKQDILEEMDNKFQNLKSDFFERIDPILKEVITAREERPLIENRLEALEEIHPSGKHVLSPQT
ncbi:MAG: hypothetical protein US53_C0007G0004 [Candidatus Woesebacteria bacterium GW2011_GWA1_37_7]|uniref:Uncharacterized protein n=1 Tax=Candidatus Woesebacteria bacterium GW2011_GWA1_37_7 TaxID=1618545 RepID=A0A0G0HH49_9BACT|nr:MAG: hypothetical protein US53_C0007G0004 [Candidatus Woesebacteria bacterium GW2011_GWA1_37_7]